MGSELGPQKKMTGNELYLYSDSKFTFRSLTLWINEVIETY